MTPFSTSRTEESGADTSGKHKKIGSSGNVTKVRDTGETGVTVAMILQGRLEVSYLLYPPPLGLLSQGVREVVKMEGRDGVERVGENREAEGTTKQNESGLQDARDNRHGSNHVKEPHFRNQGGF